MTNPQFYPEDVSELSDLIHYPYRLEAGPNKGAIKYVSGPEGIRLADMIQFELESEILPDTNGVWHQYKDDVIIFTFDQDFATKIGKFDELDPHSTGTSKESHNHRTLENTKIDRNLVIDYYRATKRHLNELTK